MRTSRMRVHGAVLAILGALGCGSGPPVMDGGVADGGPTPADGGMADGGMVDAGPFQVVAVDPPTGTVIFQRRDEIFVDFNREVDPATVDRSTFRVLHRAVEDGGVGEGIYFPSRVAPTRVRIGTVLVPEPARVREGYDVIVSASVRDLQGRTLGQDFRASYPAPRHYFYRAFGPIEGPGAGFTTEDGGVFQYGRPDGGPGACGPGPTQADCWTTGLAGAYPVLDPEIRDGGVWGRVPEDRLVSPPVDLRTAIDPVLEFQHWYELGFDGQAVAATVEVEAPDGGWSLVYPVRRFRTETFDYYRKDPSGIPERFWTGSSGGDGGFAYAGPPEWETQRFDLRPYVGRIVRFSFHFFSEAPGTKFPQKRGWYIDDVSVHQADPATLIPPDAGAP